MNNPLLRKATKKQAPIEIISQKKENIIERKQNGQNNLLKVQKQIIITNNEQIKSSIKSLQKTNELNKQPIIEKMKQNTEHLYSHLPKNQNDSAYKVLIKFQRTNATFKPQEIVMGTISLMKENQKPFKVDVERMTLTVEGKATMQNKTNKPEFNPIVQSVEPIYFIRITDMLLAQNKTLTHQTNISFRFKLEKKDHRYLETYFGIYILIVYSVTVALCLEDKTLFREQTPFYIQVPKAGRESIDNFVYPKAKKFQVCSQNTKGSIGIFKIKGQLQSEICFLGQDLSGWLMIDEAKEKIKSIQLQMLRIEKVQVEGQMLNEKTQVQMIQICDGNVTHNLQIPLFMILPRYFSCPTTKYLWYQIGFEVNLIIIFWDGFKVSVNLPIQIVRR